MRYWSCRLLRIEALADADLGSGPWAAIIFTSANAVRGIAAHRRFGELAGVPAYVVGARTQPPPWRRALPKPARPGLPSSIWCG